jgi:hypothetical protein
MAKTKAEAIEDLKHFKEQLDYAETKTEVLNVLRDAGQACAYSPAMRCLVMGQAPETSVHWKN